MDVQHSGKLLLRPMSAAELTDIGNVVMPTGSPPLIANAVAADDWPYPFLFAIAIVDAEGAVVLLGGAPTDPNKWAYEIVTSYDVGQELARSISVPVKQSELIRMGFNRVALTRDAAQPATLTDRLRGVLVRWIERKLVSIMNRQSGQ